MAMGLRLRIAEHAVFRWRRELLLVRKDIQIRRTFVVGEL